MKRKILSLILIVCFFVSMLPVMAFADDSVQSIGRIDLSNVTENQEGDGWTWDAENRILTLNNCNLSFESSGFMLPNDTVVRISGKNYIRFSEKSDGEYCFWAQNQETTGSSSLTFESVTGRDTDSLTIECVNKKQLSGHGSISLWGRNGADDNGMLTLSDVNITLYGQNSGIKATYNDSQSIKIENSYISMRAKDETSQMPVYPVATANGNITVVNSTIYGETAGKATGILYTNAGGGTVSIVNSSVTGKMCYKNVEAPNPPYYIVPIVIYGIKGVSVTEKSTVDLMIESAETLSAGSYEVAVYGIASEEGPIFIGDESTVTVKTDNYFDTSGKKSTYGILNIGGDISVTGGSTVNVSCFGGDKIIPVYASGQIKVDNSKVTSTAGTPNKGGMAYEFYSEFSRESDAESRFVLTGSAVEQGTLTDGEQYSYVTSGDSSGGTSIIAPHELTKTDYQAPSCTEDGNIEYWTCGLCGKMFSDENGENVVSDVSIAKKGHDYGEPSWRWSEDGKSCTATFTCKNDSAHVITMNAQITSSVKSDAAGTEKGVTTYKATVEFEGKTYTSTKDIADIPATGAKTDLQTPDTGDSGNTAFWIVVMLTAGSGIGISLLYGQKRKYKR